MTTARLTQTVLLVGALLLPTVGVILLLVARARRRGRAHVPATVSAVARVSALVLAWTPPIAIAGFVLLVVHERIDTGTWPTWDVPVTWGPNGFEGGPVHFRGPVRDVLAPLQAVSAIGILVVPGLFALARATERPIGRRTVRAYYAAWVALVFLVVVDPHGMYCWAFGD